MLLLFNGITDDLPAQTIRKHSINDLQAAYLFHFTNFVSWPNLTTTSDDFIICIDTPQELAQEFHDLAEKSVEGKKVYVTKVDAETVLIDCKILFFKNTEREQQNKRLSAVKDSPVLTVGTSRTFNQKNGIVQLNNSHSRVTLSINLRPAKRVGLTISANMLDVAEEVIK